jgi:hypothetical protein
MRVLLRCVPHTRLMHTGPLDEKTPARAPLEKRTSIRERKGDLALRDLSNAHRCAATAWDPRLLRRLKSLRPGGLSTPAPVAEKHQIEVVTRVPAVGRCAVAR